jgi:hypothetical protein
VNHKILLQQTRYIIKKTIEDSVAGMNPINFEYVKQVVTDNVSKYLFQQTAKRPDRYPRPPRRLRLINTICYFLERHVINNWRSFMLILEDRGRQATRLEPGDKLVYSRETKFLRFFRNGDDLLYLKTHYDREPEEGYGPCTPEDLSRLIDLVVACAGLSIQTRGSSDTALTFVFQSQKPSPKIVPVPVPA